MDANKYFKLGQAFVALRDSWNTISKMLAEDDIDVSDYYPFYLLDFETISKAVSIWCNEHANRALSQVSQTIVNPACLQCVYAVESIKHNGTFCSKATEMCCGVSGVVPFSRDAAAGVLISHGYKPGELSDLDCYLSYLKIVAGKINKAEET